MNILEFENYHEKKEHSKEGFSYNTYLCSIPLDFNQVPVHWHEEFELIYIKKGKGRITVDFKQYEVSSQDLIFILPGQLHGIRQYRDEGMEYENIIFHPDLLMPKRADCSYTNFLEPLLSGKVTVCSLFTPSQSFYRELVGPINACDEICKTHPDGYEMYIKGMLFQFFFYLGKYGVQEKSSADTRQNTDKLKTVLKYIEEHYKEKISVTSAASLTGYSESHFMRYFKQLMGVSFVSYLNDYRLIMAARLLLYSEESIMEIAFDVGFENLSNFNRFFRKKYGMTPRQYRQEH